MNSNNNSLIHIESATCWLSEHTVGELVRALDHTTLEDLVISIADEIVESEADFHDRCVRFADGVAVGKTIVDRIRECTPDWDGTWMTIMPEENAVEAAKSILTARRLFQLRRHLPPQ